MTDWADLLADGRAPSATPLVREDPDDAERCQVAFLWHSDHHISGLHVGINRVTDKELVSRGIATRIPGTPWWQLTLRLPAALRASYGFTPIPAGADAALITTLGTRWQRLPSYCDPLNPAPGIPGPGESLRSVVALDRAPPQLEWEQPRGELRGQLTQEFTGPPIAGRQRVLWHYRPPIQPRGLVVLLDAELWFPGLGVPHAVELAMASGRLPPLALLGVANRDLADRQASLGGRPELLAELSARVLALRTRFALGRTQTVLTGQSLGGLSALLAARVVPDVFGAVFAQSPSMWWLPDGSRRPGDLAPDQDAWIVDRLAEIEPSGVAIGVDVGACEGAMVDHTQRMYDRLAEAGWPITMHTYCGGHDPAWWRGALIDRLAEHYADPGNGSAEAGVDRYS